MELADVAAGIEIELVDCMRILSCIITIAVSLHETRVEGVSSPEPTAVVAQI